MTFGGEVVINLPASVRHMAARFRELGVKPEAELFDSGDIQLFRELVDEGAFESSPMASLVLGVKYGFPATGETMMFAKSLLPAGTIWSSFGIGRAAIPMVAQAQILGGHIRIGIEDTVYIARGELTAGNGELVSKARFFVEGLGGSLATSQEARSMLGLASR